MIIQVVQTSLRPDIILWSEEVRKIILIEAMVMWEDGCEDVLVEVGCRDFPAQSVWRMLKKGIELKAGRVNSGSKLPVKAGYGLRTFFFS